jgi:hypothetical protein
MKALAISLAALGMAGCAGISGGASSVSLTVTQASYGAELAFKGLDLAVNTALATGQLKGVAEHKVKVDYEKAHSALLAMRAGTGTAQAALDAITATQGEVPTGAAQ